MRPLLDKLRSKLSFLGMKQFKDLIVDVKDIGGLKLISQVMMPSLFCCSYISLTDSHFHSIAHTPQIKKFQVDLAKIILPLPDDVKLKVASDLVCLITDRNARQAYSDMLKQHFPSSGQKRKVDSTDEDATAAATQHLPSSSSSSSSSISLAYLKDVVAEDDVENVGSKRAKLLIQKSLQSQSKASNDIMSKLAHIKQEGNKSQLTTDDNTASQGSFSNQKDSFLSKLKEISSFQGVKAVGTSNAMNLNANSSSSLLKCIICKEQANNACAARCGHICCQTCWTHWLKVKSACPLCRHPTTIDSITKIRIKS